MPFKKPSQQSLFHFHYSSSAIYFTDIVELLSSRRTSQHK